MPKKVVDTDTLVALKQAGKSYREIAEITGGNKDVINRRIKDLLPDDTTKVYIENRADILAKLQCELLQGLDASKIKGASALQLITGAGILFDKERLERGQSTQNVESVITTLSSDADDLRKLKKKLLGESE